MDLKKADILSMDLGELAGLLEGMGGKKYRAAQVFRWLHAAGATSFSEMTDLPLALREALSARCDIEAPGVAAIRESERDGTRKYLFSLSDGNLVEGVLMRYRHGTSLCISSQAGCGMGCRFCASGLGGLKRNLLPSEMLGQVYAARRDIGERISNVVVMGTGEPLDNYDALLKFLALLSSEGGANVGMRSVAVSTCGIVPRMYDLAGERLGITLAVSLHAATQEKRMELMPVAARYPLEDVMEACRRYFAATGRRVTFEYALLAGKNDSAADAAALAALLRRYGAGGELKCHVNLIRANPVRELGTRPPSREAAEAFKKILEKNGINVTIRREMGRDIDGACGQLRMRQASRQAW